MNEEDYNIFTQKNNVNLNNEIESLSFKDINLRDGFIKISETTPFIYQKLGLKNLPVHVYIQKLARALFLEKESYGERRTHGHKNEFSIKEMKSVFENIRNPRYIFNSKQNFYNSGKFTLIGVYDEFDKYGNPMIITVCFDKNKYSTEANWVTSIYGKDKDVIVNDWTEKGYLLYKNDVEIKKASEEVVTLYMRISKSSNAYKDNILLKSQLVNENTNTLIENDRGEIFYDASHSTIEKGKLIDYILQNKKSGNLSPLITQRETGLEGNEMPYVYYDKRLINICQVPQMPYLEKINGKWLPTKEAVKAVKAGNLYIQKNDQEYKMIDNRNNSKDIKNNIFFTYNDFNFVAIRKFSEEERAFVDSVISDERNKKLLSKNALYYAGYLESQKPVSEQKFEKALKVFSKADFLQASNFDADIFYCREKGTFYTALNNDFLVPLEFVYSSDRQEKDVFENRFSDEIESFRNDNYDFLKGSLSYELDEKKDFALMSDISDVLSEGEIFTRRNVNIDGEIKIKLGDLFDKKNPEKIQPTGLRHLIKHRMEERLNNGLSMEEAQRETTAVLFLALNNIDKAPAVKEQNGRYAIYKNGIKTLIGKDKKGKYVVSGFDYIDTKREATDSIGTGIARYGYTPGFLEIYDQVGAVASELNIHKKNSVVNDKADSEISRVASLIMQNGGSHVRLHDAISNRAINSHYDKNNLLSINNLHFSESKNNLKESIQFEYDGLTYIPVRSLSENEKDLINNRSPKEYWNNAIIEKPKNGENYSIEDFKKKLQSQNADLFYCIERGKFFTPVENGIINLNEGLIDEHFREELNNFYNNENVQKLIKNHRPLVFNEEKDISLMQNISSVLTESEVFSKNNETLGNVRIRFGNPEHGGVSHIIKRRMDKLIKHEGMRYDDAARETSAILFLSLQNISNAPATKETNGRYAIYKNGIKTGIGKDKNGKYVVTGFNFNDTKQEAADAIKSVNALYGYTPEFLEIYAQVGAAYASLNNNINQQNVPVNDKKSDYEKMLCSSAEINVNGRIRHCKEGLIKGFENAVSRLDSCFAENSNLKNENIKLKSQLNLMNSKCEKLIQDNEELKNQALKNKIRPIGM